MRRARFLTSLAFVGLASSAFAYVACGGGGTQGAPSDAGDDATIEAGDGGETGDDAGLQPDQSQPCTSGDPCGDGGTCAGGTCCEAGSACGDVCCASGQLCSFQKCVTPGATCTDSSDCPSGDYCELSLGSGGGDAGTSDAASDGATDASCTGGAALATGRCLPRPPVCAGGGDAGTSDATPDAGSGAVTCLEKCEVHRTTNFQPTLKFSWGAQTTPPFATDVMMTPIVVQLDDDDCDGKVTARDIPEIVFSTFQNGAYTSTGVLHATSIVGGKFVDKWSVSGVVNPTKHLAGGDIDGTPGNEIVACGVDGAVHAFDGAGKPKWTSAATTCFMPSIADLDGDGVAEVIVEGGILDGKTGAVKHAFSSPLNGPFVVSDLDGDGALDIVTSSRGYHADGTLFVDTGLATDGTFAYGTSDWKGPWSAVADFDHDGKPEVVVMDNRVHALSLWRYDASQPSKFVAVRAPTDMNALFPTNGCPAATWGATHGGGPPTIADFDGDGTPDVGAAGGIGYVVFSGKKLIDPSATGAATILWAKPTTDCSSASTGSSVFDFDGDGKAEVVYSDEQHLRVFDGTNGDVLLSVCNTTATLIEYPVIADVDNDGHADIVVVSNAYAITCADDGSKQAGVRVFGDQSGAWVRTRSVWNEHAYHVTNVNDDGTIPAHEAPNWTQPGLNDFRQNKQPGSEFAAPNAIVSLRPGCFGAPSLVATVRNVGEAPLPAGAVVTFSKGTPPNGTTLGTGTTTRVLYPAESEDVVLALSASDTDVTSGAVTVYATVAPIASVPECRTDDDVSAPVSGKCAGPM